MSALTYHKAMVLRSSLKKDVKHAVHTCKMFPKSQSCRVAWDQVEELCSTLSDCEMKYRVELKHEQEIEVFPWEDESKFYDI